MRMELGPCDSASALAWIGYARTVLAQALVHHGRGPATLDPAVVGQFEQWLDEWEQVARAGPELVWTGSIDTAQALTLGDIWRELAEQLASETAVRGYPLAPPESEPFYRAVVEAFLEGLARDDTGDAGAVRRLQRSWPGRRGRREAPVSPSGTKPSTDRPS